LNVSNEQHGDNEQASDWNGRFPYNEIISLLDVNRPFNLAESTSQDLTVGELLSFPGLENINQLKLGYGTSAGALSLREAISEACKVPVDHIITTQGTALGLFLLAFEVCRPGDEAVLLTPCFPPSRDCLFGAGVNVREIKLTFEGRYRLDLDRVAANLSPKTKLVSILDAADLSTEAMQAIAGWTNLSETTFVLPPTETGADYRLRIFTPRSELPFAGHPTLGSAHALLEAGRVTPRDDGQLVQQCNVGLVDVVVDKKVEESRLAFALPPAAIAPLQPADLAELQQILGCELDADIAPATVNVGPIWTIVRLKDAASVLNLRPDLQKLAEFERRLGVTGVTAFGPHPNGDVAIEVRTFAPSCGVEEDPVCGSGNGSVAAFQWERGLLPPGGGSYVAAQGQRIGRDGRIYASVGADGQVRIGGSCITCVEGSLRL